MTRIAPLLLALLTAGCLAESNGLDVKPPPRNIVIDTDDPVTGGDDTPADETGTTTGVPSDAGGLEDIGDPGCGAGEGMCDGVCTDLIENDAHCGECGRACDGGRVCAAAQCVCEVAEFCGGACVDTTSNSQHCGMCDNACAGGEACVGGDCMAVGEVEGVLIATNAARAAGADCGSEGTFAPTNPLQGDPLLHQAAQVHADDMAANDFFSHTGSDGSSFSQRIARTGFQGQPIGENIAAGNRTAEATVQQWLNSDGHCRNLMNPNATKLGVGYTLGGPYGTLWVQVFAR